MGGNVEDAASADVVAEGLFGEVLVEEFGAGVDAVFGGGIGADDRIDFGFDGGEGVESGDRLGESESEDG